MLSSLAHVDRDEYGGKALELGRATRAGLPVPDGIALAPELVEAVVQGDGAARATVLSACTGLGAVAVRSSAIGEDGARASFAGQHLSVLNVRSERALLDAVARVHASGQSASAVGYRQRVGVGGAARMGVVIQRLVHADAAGVLFTKNPVTAADERLIEAAWGLGEAVVAGLVTPDRFRLARGGKVLERALGDKDIAVVWRDSGGTEERALDAGRAGRLCLTDAQLSALEALAVACERAFSGPHDIEWAFAGERLYLLQRRAITRG